VKLYVTGLAGGHGDLLGIEILDRGAFEDGAAV
jgi:hypothetical protein